MDRDLTVAESFDVSEMNNHPLPVQQCPQCCGQIRVQAAEYFKRLRSRKRLRECLLQEVVGIGPIAGSSGVPLDTGRSISPEHVFGPHLISDYRHSRFIGA
jgi:hypothetical protein